MLLNQKKGVTFAVALRSLCELWTPAQEDFNGSLPAVFKATSIVEY